MTNPSNGQRPRPATSVLFPMGELIATPGALSLLERHRINPLLLLGRHLQGDSGSVPDENRALASHNADHIVISALRPDLSGYSYTY
jgi:hypothetical protein